MKECAGGSRGDALSSIQGNPAQATELTPPARFNAMHSQPPTRSYDEYLAELKAQKERNEGIFGAAKERKVGGLMIE